MTRRNRALQRGVTLLELIVAITLVSLLSVGMLFAMRTGLNALERTNTRLMDNRRVAGAQAILERQILGLVPARTACMPGNQAVPFFQGEPQTLRFVSSYSLEEGARGYPRILEFQVLPGDRGRYRLVVNEFLYTGPASLAGSCVGVATDPGTGLPRPLFRPFLPNPRSFVLADNLAACQFFFRQLSPDQAQARWLPSWGGEFLPSAIRVELLPAAIDPSRLPLTSVTVPVRVTREPLGPYADIDP